MNNKDLLDKFGALLMENVRDRAIYNFESTQAGKMKSQSAIEQHHLLSQFNNEQQAIIKELVIDAIDNTIFNFLFMFEDNEEIKLMVLDKVLTEISDGLAGELFSEEGWISCFSKK